RVAATRARESRDERGDPRRRAGRRGRRRSGGGGARGGCRPARGAVGGPWNVWCRVRCARAVRGRSGWARPRVLPRGTAVVACDGGDAVRGRLASVAAFGPGARYPLRRVDRRRRELATR